MRAARAGRPEDFNQLADRRAALGAKDKRGRTLLHHAVSGGSWPIVERVLQVRGSRGAPPHVVMAPHVFLADDLLV